MAVQHITTDTHLPDKEQPFEIVPYSSEDRTEVVELLNLALGEKPGFVRDAAYWEWKHEGNPAGRSLMLVAKAAGSIVGVRTFMRWRFAYSGEVIEAAKPVDSVTHPAFQRRGIFSWLTTAACELADQERVAFLFNTPNEKSRPGYLKLGWRYAATLPIAVKVLRPIAGCLRLGKFQCGFGATAEEASYFKMRPLLVREVFQDELRIRSFLNRCKHCDERLRTERTFEWFHWRYAQHPHLAYYCETVERNGRIRGLLIYRVGTRRGLREALIDDVLVAADDDEKVLQRLVQQMSSRLPVDYLAAHVPVHPTEADRWRRCGFRNYLGKRVCLLARPLASTDTANLTDSRSWALALGDIEGL